MQTCRLENWERMNISSARTQVKHLDWRALTSGSFLGSGLWSPQTSPWNLCILGFICRMTLSWGSSALTSDVSLPSWLLGLMSLF